MYRAIMREKRTEIKSNRDSQQQRQREQWRLGTIEIGSIIDRKQKRQRALEIWSNRDRETTQIGSNGAINIESNKDREKQRYREQYKCKEMR